MPDLTIVWINDSHGYLDVHAIDALRYLGEHDPAEAELCGTIVAV